MSLHLHHLANSFSVLPLPHSSLSLATKIYRVAKETGTTQGKGGWYTTLPTLHTTPSSLRTRKEEPKQPTISNIPQQEQKCNTWALARKVHPLTLAPFMLVPFQNPTSTD